MNTRRQPEETESFLHPLLMPDIMKNVFGFLELNHVKPFRTVCWDWYHSVCEATRLREKIVLADDDSITSYMQTFSQDAAKMYHSDYTFYHPDLSSKILDEFLFLYGDHMKAISFQQRRINEPDLYKILYSYTPNLETLTLRALPGNFPNRDGEEMENPEEDDELLSTLPSIRSLVLGDSHNMASREQFNFNHPDDDPEVTMHDSMIRLLRQLPNLHKLKLSKLDTVNNDRTLEFVEFLLRCLADAGPTLLQHMTHLEFSIDTSGMVTDPLLGLASLKLKKLRCLDIKLHQYAQNGPLSQVIRLARLSLRELSLAYPVNPQTTFVPTGLINLRVLTLTRFLWSLQFLKDFQALHSLTLIDTNVDNVLPTQEEPLVVQLEIFKVTGTAGRQPMDDLEITKRIIRSFPKLKTLHAPLGVGDEALRSIYMNLPMLEDLSIPSGTFTDEGITGISNNICADLLQTSEFNYQGAERVRTMLYIGCLPELRRLRVESKRMTVMSVLLGIFDCLRLRHLTLVSPRITDESIMVMLGRLNGPRLDVLDVQGCSGVTEIGRNMADQIGPAVQLSAEELAQENHSSLIFQALNINSKTRILNQCANIDIVLKLFGRILPADRVLKLRKYLIAKRKEIITRRKDTTTTTPLRYLYPEWILALANQHPPGFRGRHREVTLVMAR